VAICQAGKKKKKKDKTVAIAGETQLSEIHALIGEKRRTLRQFLQRHRKGKGEKTKKMALTH